MTPLAILRFTGQLAQRVLVSVVLGIERTTFGTPQMRLVSMAHVLAHLLPMMMRHFYAFLIVDASHGLPLCS